MLSSITPTSPRRVPREELWPSLDFSRSAKERKFEKKVRYASRKRLAEARPRVRGQFVKKTVATEEVPTTTTAKTTTATTNSDEEANIPSEGTLKMEVAEEE